MFQIKSLKRVQPALALEILSWLIILSAIIFVRATPYRENLDPVDFNLLVGGVLGFLALLYYLLWRKLSQTKRLYLLNIAQVVVIGLLFLFVKEMGPYFFSLFLIPIVTTALTLEALPSILLVALACFFVALETVLAPQINIFGLFQFGLIILVTIFCRFLALALKEERQKTIQAELRAKELEETERVSREFITLTSHQLLTPLSIIRSFASLFKSGDLGRLNERQQEAMNQIHANSVRMVHLVEELLTVSRLEEGKLPFYPKQEDLVALVENVVASFKQKTEEKGLYLRFKKPAVKKIVVNIDPGKIENVLFNFLDNAVKYTQKGGIVVELKIEETPKRQEAVCSVTDTGVGIPPEYLDRCFQPFLRGPNILELDKKGVGLGLFVARLFVEKQGGRVGVESKLNQGSTFYFSLPILHIDKEEK